MAKVKRIDGVVLSGKVGGLVYKHNLNGHYVQPYRKKRAAKVNSQQYLQQFASLATHWRTLDAIEQYSWEAARFHFPKFKRNSEPIILTRKQLYMSHSAILMTYCGFNLDTIPKLAPTPAPILPVSRAIIIDARKSTQRLTVNVSFTNGMVNVPPDHVLVIYASMPTKFVSGEGPSLPCIIFTTLNSGALPATYNMWFDYAAKFALLQANDLVWFEFKTVHSVTGQVSGKVRIKIYIQL